MMAVDAENKPPRSRRGRVESQPCIVTIMNQSQQERLRVVEGRSRGEREYPGRPRRHPAEDSLSSRRLASLSCQREKAMSLGMFESPIHPERQFAGNTCFNRLPPLPRGSLCASFVPGVFGSD